ncbi:acetolactate synthase small subunit [Desulfitobacterium hafniense]|nr:acetolactate synthase small subunit [Desulfitobacterium hafniense]KTE93410.1 acetolactate synthase small subunit [Desulfitobacterium hafniense]CDW99978.1 Acetolactate synthase, small subunit [Desulfitobacterium hafniense]
MMKRWISLLVENEIGVLARVSSLFSGKSYNLDSLTVGATEDNSISRMTISLTSDDQTFEQIKKQLNRSVEVIKVVDFTDVAIHMKELMFIKISDCTQQEMIQLTHIISVFALKMIDYDADTAIIECVQTEDRNNNLIRLFEKTFPNRFSIVRGGGVAIEAINLSNG